MIELGRSAPWIVLIIAILVVVIVLYIVYLLRRAAVPEGAYGTEPQSPAPAPAEPPPPEPVEKETTSRLDLRAAFRRGVSRLRKRGGGLTSLYSIPWALALDGDGTGEAEAWATATNQRLDASRLDLRIGDGRLNFFFFKNGVLLDLGSAALDRGQQGLHTVLQLLQKRRPRLPLEAVVVTLSAAGLRAGRQDRDTLDLHAERLEKALQRIQSQLALQLPIYLVVTGCEALPSFADFGHAMPERLRHEMLGWSNPYEPETTYQGRWIDEAFDTLSQRLRGARTEVFAVSGDESRNAGVLLFPGEAAELAEPLRVITDRLFQPSAYHDPLRLRGLWLTGRQPSTGQSFFLRDVLDAKVFLERGLVRPGARAAVSRNRTVRRLQLATVATALVLAIGSFFAYRGHAVDRDIVLPELQQAQVDLAEMRDERSLQMKPNARRAKAFNLLRALADLQRGDALRVFLPASWLDPGNTTDAALEILVRELVLDSVRELLQERAQGLATEVFLSTGGDVVRPVVGLPPLFPTQTDELARYRDYMSRIRELDQQAIRYNSLLRAPTPRELADIVEYAFGDQAPAGFDNLRWRRNLFGREDDVSLYGTPVDLSRYRHPIGHRIDRLADEFWRRITTGSRLDRALNRLAVELDATLVDAYQTAGDLTSFQTTLDLIRWLDDALAGPQYEWAFRSDLVLGEEYDAILASAPPRESMLVETPLLLQETKLRWLERRGVDQHATFRRLLVGRASNVTGPLLLSESGEPLMQLSPELQVFRTALRNLLRERFFGEADLVRGLEPTALGSRLLWDKTTLERALALYPPYQSFRDRGLQAFPIRMRSSIDEVSRRHLVAQMVELIDTARQEVPLSSALSPQILEQELRSDIANLSTVIEDLEQALTVFATLGDPRSDRALRSVLIQQGASLLQRVERLLEREQLYRPRGGTFTWWDGRGAPALEAFALDDPAQLQGYLDIQRQRATTLATAYAQPVLGLLGRLDVDRRPETRALAERWHRLLEALADFEAQKPGNAVSELEAFVLGPMTELRLTDRRRAPQTVDAVAATADGAEQTRRLSCAALTRSGPPRGLDYFTDRRRRLRSGLVERCIELAGSRGIEGYEELRAFFASRLAGRYPFAAGTGAFGQEARIDDLQQLMRLVDRVAPVVASAPTDLGFGASGLEARRFVEDLVTVRAFFAPWLDAAEPTPEPVYDVDVTFRVERTLELEGNQIIEWTLTTGDATVRSTDDAQRGRWTPGDVVELGMRWAKDAPRMPAGRIEDPRLQVEGGRAMLRFDNQWALFSLLEERAAPRATFRGLVDPEPHTLRFDLSTQPTPVADADDRRRRRDDPPRVPELEPMRVFVRLQLFAPGTERPLRLPRFPEAAPRLQPDDATAP
ncbi:MAG: type VI secretion system protein [Acidobacteriota bacterium]